MTAREDAESRVRGIEAGQRAQAAARAAKGRERRCYFDGDDISHRRADAWHCGPERHPLAWHQRAAMLAAKDRVVKRPRCMICPNPLDPKRKGVTCSRACAVKRWNWFRRG